MKYLQTILSLPFLALGAEYALELEACPDGEVQKLVLLNGTVPPLAPPSVAPGVHASSRAIQCDDENNRASANDCNYFNDYLSSRHGRTGVPSSP
jgi:hypothetical protein